MLLQLLIIYSNENFSIKLICNDRLIEKLNLLDQTHLVAVGGLIHQEVSTKVRQRGELN